MAKITSDVSIGTDWMPLEPGDSFVEVSEVLGGAILFRFGAESTSRGIALIGSIKSDETIYVKAKPRLDNSEVIVVITKG